MAYLIAYLLQLQCEAVITRSIFSKFPTKKQHRIARPWGKDMGYLLWITNSDKLMFCINHSIEYRNILYRVISTPTVSIILYWRHNDHDGVSNHQPLGCLLNRLFRRRSKKPSKLRVTGLCVGKSPGPVNSPHKGPVTRKMFTFDDVIMLMQYISPKYHAYGWQVARFVGRFRPMYSYISGLLHIYRC